MPSILVCCYLLCASQRTNEGEEIFLFISILQLRLRKSVRMFLVTGENPTQIGSRNNFLFQVTERSRVNGRFGYSQQCYQGPVSFHVSALPSTESPFFSGGCFLGVQDGCLQLPEFCTSFVTPSRVSPHSLQDAGAPSDWTSLGHTAMTESMT